MTAEVAQAPVPKPDPEFDPARLDAFLRGAIEGADGPMTIERIAGGQSNPTFFVGYPARRLVLRKQPPGELLPSAHAVDREYRVLTALAGSDVPVPRTLLFHAERDVVGTPFYVMERLEGRVFHDSSLPGVNPAERTAMYRAMAGTLASLHKVDWQAAGLADFGRPGNYFQRQVGRWARQWQLSRTHDVPEIDRLAAWLADHVPPGEASAIAHGDYRVGNLMFHPTEPKVVGVLDWELSTIGHPLADAAFSCLGWHSAPGEYGGVLGFDLEALGIPTQEDYLETYYRASGSGERVEPFHIAFALFRFAVILEGVAARAKAGNAAAEDAARVGALGVAFARRAAGLIGD
ncbi:MAG TPA: phosphotransferase family protein [Arenibaculum sp.]|nr:phosphotransferase family protein [Arenibaculum sp.]